MCMVNNKEYLIHPGYSRLILATHWMRIFDSAEPRQISTAHMFSKTICYTKIYCILILQMNNHRTYEILNGTLLLYHCFNDCDD